MIKPSFEGRNALGLTEKAYEHIKIELQPTAPNEQDISMQEAFPDIYERYIVSLLLEVYHHYGEWGAITWPFIDANMTRWSQKRSSKFTKHLLLLICSFGCINRFERAVWREFAFGMSSPGQLARHLSRAMQRLIDRRLIVSKTVSIDEVEVGIYEPTNWLASHLAKYS